MAFAAASAAGPFTEFDVRRIGPVRRYFVRHPRVMDAVVAAWFAIPALLSSLIVLLLPEEVRGDIGERWHGGVNVAIAVVVTALLLRRRDEPVLVASAITSLAVASTAATMGTGGVEFAMVLAMYAVAAARPPLVAWAVLLGGTAVFTAAALLFYPDGFLRSSEEGPSIIAGRAGQSEAVGVPAIVLLVIGMLLALAIGTSVRARRQHEADLVDRTNALARDRDQQSRLAVAAERARIAREMHDVVAHSLTVMVALAEGAKAAGGRDPASAGRALDALGETGRDALDDMRRVLGVLRDPDSDAPLAPERAVPLEELAERFRAAGLPVRLVLQGPVPPEGSPVRDAAGRIVQEALTNALRYAPGTGLALVELSRRDERADGGGDWLDVLVVDEGPAARGRVVERIGSGRGIVGMRERAALHGGTVTAGPEAAGWRVHATLRLDGPSPTEGAT